MSKSAIHEAFSLYVTSNECFGLYQLIIVFLKVSAVFVTEKKTFFDTKGIFL
jgi:hypothetical protein